MLKDTDQARRMLNMRIKIDVWSKGLDENVREQIRENLRELFCTLMPRRVWYYLKHIRNLELKGSKRSQRPGFAPGKDDLVLGPEDVVVNRTFRYQTNAAFASYKTNSNKVCQLFRPDALCRLMYSSTLNQIHLVKNPDFDLGGVITMDEKGAKRLRATRAIAFGSAGKFTEFLSPVSRYPY